MDEIAELKQRMAQERPVEWEAFPDLGLYMDQIISYMPRQLIHYNEEEALTSAMVNNYIKDGMLPGPRASGIPASIWPTSPPSALSSRCCR